MKALQIVQSAYRCTVEEQDDPVVWIAQVLKNIGGDVDILLRGNAVNYTVKGQDGSGLSFGNWKQNHPSKLDEDLTHCLENGLKVFVIEEDVRAWGIPQGELITGITAIPRHQLPDLFSQYDQIWHW